MLGDASCCVVAVCVTCKAHTYKDARYPAPRVYAKSVCKIWLTKSPHQHLGGSGGWPARVVRVSISVVVRGCLSSSAALSDRAIAMPVEPTDWLSLVHQTNDLVSQVRPGKTHSDTPPPLVGGRRPRSPPPPCKRRVVAGPTWLSKSSA